MASCAWTEKTDQKTATNYQGEALGAILAQLLLRAAWEGHNVPAGSRVSCGYDNMGVVGHGNEFWSPLQENQAQSDLLRVFKKLVTTAPLRPDMYHVYAHQDRNLRLDQLDVHEQTNVLADTLASDDLIASLSSGRFITGAIPFDDICLQVGKRRVSGFPTKAIYNFWGGTGSQKVPT